MNKYLRISEIAWLVITIVCLVLGIWQTYQVGIEESYYFFIFTFVAAILFAVRRRQRKKSEDQ